MFALGVCSLAVAQFGAEYPALGGQPVFEAAMLDATNRARAANGVGRLEPDDRLALAARHHAKEMAELDYLSHESPTPGRQRLSQRVFAAGSAAQEVAENLFSKAAVRDYDPAIAQEAITGWLDSPSHRVNLLYRDFTHVGFGAWIADGRLYVVQVFAVQPFVLSDAGVTTRSEQGYEVDVSVALRRASDVRLGYGSRRFAPRSLAPGEHVLSFQTETTELEEVHLSVWTRSANNAGFIMEDAGWLNLPAADFRPDRTPIRDAVSVREVATRVVELRYYDVVVTFADPVAPSSAELVAVGLEPPNSNVSQLASSYWNGNDLYFTVPSASQDATIRIGIRQGQSIDVFASLVLDLSGPDAVVVPKPLQTTGR
ncbi:MAG: CAP domain-containing protein [Trueperaceae bacterium]|nr:CAP domain-containing protein [Trueperaceae bacterium]